MNFSVNTNNPLSTTRRPTIWRLHPWPKFAAVVPAVISLFCLGGWKVGWGWECYPVPRGDGLLPSLCGVRWLLLSMPARWQQMAHRQLPRPSCLLSVTLALRTASDPANTRGRCSVCVGGAGGGGSEGENASLTSLTLALFFWGGGGGGG